jgi:hypothetical protein
VNVSVSRPVATSPTDIADLIKKVLTTPLTLADGASGWNRIAGEFNNQGN